MEWFMNDTVDDKQFNELQQTVEKITLIKLQLILLVHLLID